MLITRKILLLLTLLISLTSCETTAPENNKQSILWKIEGKDSKVSYLCGILPIINCQSYELPEKVVKAHSNSDCMVFEIDLDNTEVMKEVNSIVEVENPNECISSLISEEKLKVLKAFLKKDAGCDVKTLDKYKPFFVANWVMLTAFKDCSGEMKTMDVRKLFMKLSKESGKEIIGLETVKECASGINSVSSKECANHLVYMVEHQEETKDMILELQEAFIREDIQGFKEVAEDCCVENKHSTFIEDKIVLWKPRMQKLMNERSCMFVVGADFLSDDTGLIESLRKEGYTVTAVNN